MNRIALKEKAEVLAKVITLTAELYHDHGLNEAQIGLLETLVGAGIWYLPSSVELYSGYISVNAYLSLKADPINTKLVEEHSFPRKIAGQKLYTKEIVNKLNNNSEYLSELYENAFGKFNLVLKNENDKLKAFQKKGTFSTPTEAYAAAGIDLISFDKSNYIRYKKFKNSLKNKKKLIQPYEID
jgi:hypothetical protein